MNKIQYVFNFMINVFNIIYIEKGIGYSKKINNAKINCKI